MPPLLPLTVLSYCGLTSCHWLPLQERFSWSASAWLGTPGTALWLGSLLQAFSKAFQSAFSMSAFSMGIPRWQNLMGWRKEDMLGMEKCFLSGLFWNSPSLFGGILWCPFAYHFLLQNGGLSHDLWVRRQGQAAAHLESQCSVWRAPHVQYQLPSNFQGNPNSSAVTLLRVRISFVYTVSSSAGEWRRFLLLLFGFLFFVFLPFSQQVATKLKPKAHLISTQVQTLAFA